MIFPGAPKGTRTPDQLVKSQLLYQLSYRRIDQYTFPSSQSLVIDEFIDQAGGVNTEEAHEIGDIYMAYEDDDPDLYNLLPVEAQLFAE